MDNKYYVEILNNKIWAYKIIYGKEPNTIIIPNKIFEAVRCEIASMGKKIIVSDDFKEMRCIDVIWSSCT